MKLSAEKAIRLIITLLIFLAFVVAPKSILSKTSSNLKKINFIRLECLKEKGNWLEKHRECENMSQKTCEKLGGVYNECASTCRHMKTDACIAMCQPVCSFEKEIKP